MLLATLALGDKAEGLPFLTKEILVRERLHVHVQTHHGLITFYLH